MEIRINKDGSKSYKEKVRIQGNRTLTKTFKRKTDAVLWKNQTELELLKNEALGISPLKDNHLFKDFFELWMERKITPVRSPKTIADYWGIGRKHFFKQFGHIPLRSFERFHADILIQNLSKLKRTPKTINKILALYKQVFLFAEIENYINKSPYKNFQKVKAPAGRIDFLSVQEILQLLRNNSTEEIYPLLVVALNTGMRIGELTGLCWDRLNFETDTIEVSRSQTREGLKNSTKTHLIRYIPMNSEVKNVFMNLMRNQKSPQYVFTKNNGEPYNPDHFSKRYFEAALDRAGVRRINFHVLRHTYASQFMMKNGNINDLQKILGHTSITMTMKYIHLSPQHLKGVVDTVKFSADGDFSVSGLKAVVSNP